ncbi:uncharacterized protein ARMOST_20670 [Armillaria ostoyae]|uniref:Uncharacterized protein n=1 Tax=Armillaria ostoyae TaxID=47428 RepID=A0A284S808_ARMOS|nr:uncharacterized protein ARMOST_20670 [Armillaria ostoyae]
MVISYSRMKNGRPRESQRMEQHQAQYSAKSPFSFSWACNVFKIHPHDSTTLPLVVYEACAWDINMNADPPLSQLVTLATTSGLGAYSNVRSSC